MSQQQSYRVVFLDRCTFSTDLSLARPAVEHDWQEYERTAPQEVISRLEGAAVAITNKVPIRAETMEALPSLKLIAVAATGYDVVDVEAARKRGIVVCNVRGYAEHTVPEHAFSLILALRRSLLPYRQSVIDGRWQEANSFCYFDYPISDLNGQRLGIVGEGVIGQAVARIGQAFGMKTMFAAHKGSSGLGPLYTPFDEVLETSDVITLHSPLLPATRNMISRAEFQQMKRRPLLINTSRGGLVDEDALVWAIEQDLIAGAGFDVLTSEPPEPDHPFHKILSHPRVIITPHVAWGSLEAQQEVWRQVIAGVEGFAKGHVPNAL